MSKNAIERKKRANKKYGPIVCVHLAQGGQNIGFYRSEGEDSIAWCADCEIMLWEEDRHFTIDELAGVCPDCFEIIRENNEKACQ